MSSSTLDQLLKSKILTSTNALRHLISILYYESCQTSFARAQHTRIIRLLAPTWWNSRWHWYYYILPNPPLLYLTFILMNSQLSNERKQQPSSLPSSRGNNKQPVATWFSQHSFFRFKLKSAGFFSHSRSSSSKSNSSLSSDPSLSRSQSQSTTISKDSIYASSSTSVSNQASVASVKKSSKVGQTLDAMSSKFEAPTSTIATHSCRPIRSTVPQTTSEYRQPISNFFATIPGVPGVRSLWRSLIVLDWFICLDF